MKKTYHISPSTTIIRNGKTCETLEFQPSGWPIWPSDDPAADAQKRNKVLCAWLPVAAKELKSLLTHPTLYPLMLLSRCARKRVSEPNRAKHSTWGVDEQKGVSKNDPTNP